MALIVQKYGGSSVATPEQIHHVAKRIGELRKQNHKLIIVVSAMGNTTDELSQLAYRVSPAPHRREFDMLLSTGERVASALMSMALNDIGCSAVSFTGSQAGIFTDESHTNARVIDIKPHRIEQELDRGRVVVLAGFQGVSPATKEITTLGRGGSDLTAICMAEYFKADRCEILKEIDGVFTADPKIVSNAYALREISHAVLFETTFWGAKMLHHRAAELITRSGHPLYIGLAHSDGKGTHVTTEGTNMFEAHQVLSVNSHAHVVRLKIKGKSHADSYETLKNFLDTHQLPWPQILDSTFKDGVCSVLATAPVEILEAIANLSEKENSVSLDTRNLASVTATCAGAIASDLIRQLTHKVEENHLKALHVLISPMSVTFIVENDKRELAVQALHSLI